MPVSVRPPTPSTVDQGTFFAKWVGAAVLLLFVGPSAIALIVLVIWFLIPSIRGRGRDLRLLLGPTFGGCAGLAAWTLMSHRSPLEDGLVAQMMLIKSVVFWLGCAGPGCHRPVACRRGPIGSRDRTGACPGGRMENQPP